MEGTKEIVTLISSSTHLILNDGSAATGATQYRSLTGGMQYLSLTRPDIAYTVNKLAQFRQAPTQSHWTSAKRLLRYLKTTISHGLVLCKSSDLQLTAYSDADWAGY